MDLVVTQVLRDYPKAVVMLLTALSQQPWRDTRKCTYRPKSFADFLAFAGIPINHVAVKPVMAEEFYLLIHEPSTADEAERRLAQLFVGDQPLMRAQRSGNDLFCGCAINSVQESKSTIRRVDGAERPFADVMNMVHSIRSGRHHPDGAWWIRAGRHRVVTERVPLTIVAPTVLAHFGVEPPSQMRGAPLAGIGSSGWAATPA
jgi:hypothetical protein